MTVLSEILEWSATRPSWQRDALRRLVVQGSLRDEDIVALALLCKKSHGLADGPSPLALTAQHLPKPEELTQSVSLRSLTHHAGVNALAPQQAVEFGPQLTVVYGENAAGKSGYTRILKRACRARGAEDILGNVVSPASLGSPAATIAFDVDGQPHSHRWRDNNPLNPFLSRISVFDHHCASVYVAQKTDVAFRPMGLDLFDKLSDACEAVKGILERERRTLAIQRLTLPAMPPNTEVARLITNLTSLTDPSNVKALASLTGDDIARVENLRSRLTNLQSRDHDRTARAMQVRAGRVRALAAKLRDVAKVSSSPFSRELFERRNLEREARDALREHRAVTFTDQPLRNTGSAAWRRLWDAAKLFSERDAYRDRTFPVTEAESRCVLCQQELTDDGARRFRRFGDFLGSSLKVEYDRAAVAYNDSANQLRRGIEIASSAAEMVPDLDYDDSATGQEVRAWLEASLLHLRGLEEALSNGLPWQSSLRSPLEAIEAAEDHANKLEDRARELRSGDHLTLIGRLEEQLLELEARQVLAVHLDQVLEDIERRKRSAAYQECIADTRTNAITRKSTEVTKRAVTEQLTSTFQTELSQLDFGHVEVRLAVAGGSRGALYHKLQLRRAPGVEVAKVVSEGEARCLSIASFFAELSTAAHRSSILFDDPVSSLDHTWRRNVANRLVVESQSRQVVVFTHDIVFLLALTDAARELGVDVMHQRLRRDHLHSGLTSQEIPWVAMPVRKRIGQLKKLAQEAGGDYRRGRQNEYEVGASRIYGLLRESWERGVEEVLLGGTVERYRHSIETKRAMQLSDICSADLTALDSGMTKCSIWLAGHDSAPGGNAPFPSPAELESDIQTLETWVQGIRDRRRKGR